MKFKSVTIKDFKRFTELTVRGIPETARLTEELLAMKRSILDTRTDDFDNNLKPEEAIFTTPANAY